MCFCNPLSTDPRSMWNRFERWLTPNIKQLTRRRVAASEIERAALCDRRQMGMGVSPASRILRAASSMASSR